ncbi:MAG: hypothetical protein ABI473_13445 [Candidatus Dormibacter sp.]
MATKLADATTLTVMAARVSPPRLRRHRGLGAGGGGGVLLLPAAEVVIDSYLPFLSSTGGLHAVIPTVSSPDERTLNNHAMSAVRQALALCDAIAGGTRAPWAVSAAGRSTVARSVRLTEACSASV